MKEESIGDDRHWMYRDGMVEHDMLSAGFLALLEELGIYDNTMIMYSTDNGPHKNHMARWGNHPFRGEKNTNWEGGWRVPAMVDGPVG